MTRASDIARDLYRELVENVAGYYVGAQSHAQFAASNRAIWDRVEAAGERGKMMEMIAAAEIGRPSAVTL